MMCLAVFVSLSFPKNMTVVIHWGLNSIFIHGGRASEKAHLTRAGFEPTILVSLTPYYSHPFIVKGAGNGYMTA